VAPERTILDGATVVTMNGTRIVHATEHELTQSAVRAHRTLLARASTVTCKEGTAL
jgi:hypothetical protein